MKNWVTFVVIFLTYGDNSPSKHDSGPGERGVGGNEATAAASDSHSSQLEGDRSGSLTV